VHSLTATPRSGKARPWKELRAKSPSSPGWGAVSAEQLPFAWPEEGADIIGVDVLADIESIPYSMATPEDLAEGGIDRKDQTQSDSHTASSQSRLAGCGVARVRRAAR